jgi:hypothetical protein
MKENWKCGSRALEKKPFSFCKMNKNPKTYGLFKFKLGRLCSLNNKRAAIDIQFNWIYVAIVGAVILLLVGSIVVNIRKSSRQSLEYEAINYFDNIFTSMQSSENTEHSAVIPGMDIEIATPKREEDSEFCDDYRIKGSTIAKKSIEFVPVFSPDVIKKRIVSYALGWDSPFRANYFLLMTSPDIAYAVVGNQPQLMEDLPNLITKKAIGTMSSLSNQNYYKIRYILVNEEPEKVSGSVGKLKDSEVTAVKIIPESGLYDGGKVVFYKKKGTGFEEDKTVMYTDMATLFAAIYSETPYSYECNIAKAVRRLSMVSGIIKTRTTAIRAAEMLPMCQALDYGKGYSLLESLEQTTSDYKKPEMNRILELKRELNSLNTEINRKSCPTLY